MHQNGAEGNINMDCGGSNEHSEMDPKSGTC